MRNLKQLSDQRLLGLHSAVLAELRTRQLVRTSNTPGADYAELLASRALRLKLNVLSTAGYDGTDAAGKKYEIKCRRITAHNSSRQLSAIRGLEHRKFDFLVGVLFDADFKVARAVLVPYGVVKRCATFVASTNSWKFILRESVWKMPGVKDITSQLGKVQKWE